MGIQKDHPTLPTPKYHLEQLYLGENKLPSREGGLKLDQNEKAGLVNYGD